MPRIIGIGDPTNRRKPPMKDGVPLLTLPKRLSKKLSSTQYVDIKRAKGSDRMSVVLPNGESYLLDLAHMRLFLKVVGMRGEEAEKLLDFTYNFRETTLDLKTLLPTVTYERNRRLSAWGRRK